MLIHNAIIALLVITVGVLVWQLLSQRACRKQRFVLGPWPVARTALPDVHPAFAMTPLGPSLDTLASIIGNTGVFASTSDTEAWILAVLAKQSQRIFEFGTCSGKTTYVLGMNAPADAQIITITLAPEQLPDYHKTQADDDAATAAAIKESRFREFYYSGTPVEKNVVQLFGDSKVLDETPYLASCDLIFIDGSHAYSYVVSDTEKALRMVKPGGMILWHDYKGPRVAAGVFQALNEYSNRMKLMHIAGTTLVAYRAPA